MHVAVATPPSDPVVSTDDAKAHLKVDFDDDDDLIEGFVAAATALLDGPDGLLGRALSAQTLVATIEGFPGEPREILDHLHRERMRWHGLALRCLPIGVIESVSYIDPTGAPATVDASVYALTPDGRLRLAFDQAWPQARSRRDPVTITYTAGYETLPKPIRAAILLMVGDLYENRDAQVISESRATSIVNLTAQRLLDPFFVRRA